MWPEGAKVSGGWGIDALHKYSSVRDLSILVGSESANPWTEVFAGDRLFKQLTQLPHLSTLELRFQPYTNKLEFPESWPAFLPSLKIFRTNCRSIIQFVAQSTADNAVHFEALVSHQEIASPLVWADHQYAEGLFLLLEHLADHFDKREDDRRSLSVRAIEVATPEKWESRTHPAPYYCYGRPHLEEEDDEDLAYWIEWSIRLAKAVPGILKGDRKGNRLQYQSYQRQSNMLDERRIVMIDGGESDAPRTRYEIGCDMVEQMRGMKPLYNLGFLWPADPLGDSSTSSSASQISTSTSKSDAQDNDAVYASNDEGNI